MTDDSYKSAVELLQCINENLNTIVLNQAQLYCEMNDILHVLNKENSNKEDT